MHRPETHVSNRHRGVTDVLAAAFAWFALVLVMPATAFAQCQGWLSGPFANGAEGTNGVVHAMTLWDPDGAGPKGETLVVGGSFTMIQGTNIGYLAMWNTETGSWAQVGPGGSVPPVRALTVFEGKLVVGSAGDDNSGTLDAIVHTWDGSSWQSLAPSNTGSIYTLAVHGGSLYAGGNFNIEPTPPQTGTARRVARWDPSNNRWASMNTSVVDGDVYALVSWNGDLIAGGTFTELGPHQGGKGIARWAGDHWASLGLDAGTVTDLQPYLGGLYVGGTGLVDGSALGGLARWNGSGWSSVGGYFDGAVNELGTYNGRLVIAGFFPGTSSPNITQYDGASYSGLGDGIDYYVNAMQSYAGLLYTGGNFDNAGGMPATFLARWNGSGWSTVGGGSVGGVLCMTNFMGSLVAAGGFSQSTYEIQPAVNIAAWDGTSLSPFGSGLNGQVNALKAFQYPGPFGEHELIAGGYFTIAGGVVAGRIARWRVHPFSDFPAWEPMGAGMDGAVLTIERYNGATYAGGNFWASGATALANIGRWNETTDVWENIVGANGVVYALKAYGGYLYAGGSFTAIGGVFTTGGLARYNGSSWSAVGGFFNGTVYELEVYNGVLVIGGDFTGINSSPDLAYYDGFNYGTFATGGSNAAVTALHANGSRLYVGGTFSTAGGVPANHAAYWDGAWHDASVGANNTVYAFGSIGGEEQVGGMFTTVGPGALFTPGWARFTATGLPWFLQQPYAQSVTSGADVSFTARPAPGYSQTLHWRHEGAPMQNGPSGTGSTVFGASEETLTLENVSLADAGSYDLVATNSCGDVSSVVATLTVDGVTDAGPAEAITADAVEGFGPNPTTGTARMTFALTRAARVQMRIHDVAGRRVRTIDASAMPAGHHHLMWDGRDDAGQGVRTGLYFVRLEADGRELGSRRLVVQR